ncbi:RCC1 domain-containing protein [Caldalkalibacillus mannanilyticus]|uniref:RCC1 domain-containing protein n=1 Tax=Caldalkalibacillus mannanilyticus TaxID=1418 RepID=UPI0004694FF7|nr:stalk domain-containing protein [Caldalkalibacillus mannanilyticus]
MNTKKKVSIFIVKLILILSLILGGPSSILANTVKDDKAAVYTGNNVSFALSKGQVWVWGENNFGKLGIGNDDLSLEQTTAVSIPNFDNVKALATGSDHVLAFKNDGTVWGWGRNDKGQLGLDHTQSPILSPVHIKSLDQVKGIFAGNNYSVILKEDGTVWTFGDFTNGKLGQGDLSQDQLTPKKIEGFTHIKWLAVGNEHVVALKQDDTVWAWGANKSGRVGNGNEENQFSPVKIEGLSKIKTIVAGNEHSFAIQEDGAVYAWGRNHKGQLGNGKTEDSLTPILSQLVTDLKPKAIEAGGNFTMAIAADGNVWTWGDNGHGRLGAGRHIPSESIIPVKVQKGEGTGSGEFLEGIIQLATRNNHVLALHENGTVLAWGNNNKGQLADGFTGNIEFTPIKSLVPKLIGKDIVLTIGQTKVSVGEKELSLDVAPYIDHATSRTFVPIRFVSEALDAKVEWLAQERQIKITEGTHHIVLTIGSSQAIVNGKKMALDAPAEIKNGRAFVPIRFISEVFGASVDYQSQTKKITISK